MIAPKPRDYILTNYAYRRGKGKERERGGGSVKIAKNRKNEEGQRPLK